MPNDVEDVIRRDMVPNVEAVYFERYPCAKDRLIYRYSMHCNHDGKGMNRVVLMMSRVCFYDPNVPFSVILDPVRECL